MTRPMNPRIFGVDPSLTATGVCTDGSDLHTIRTDADTPRRLFTIVDRLEDLLIGDMPMVVLEDLPSHARAAGLTGMAQGAIRFRLQEFGIPYATVPPASLKKFATGRGNATKPDMRMELYKRAGIDCADDNQVDAWWLREAGRQHYRHPDALDLPKTHLAALASVQWPDLEGTP